METTLLIPLAALALDLAVGDPHGWPHPVRLIGAILNRLESQAATLSPAGKRRMGLACLLLVGLGSYFAVAGLCALPKVGWIFALYFAFAGLSLGQLLREGLRAARFIECGDMYEAKRAVSQLVSRDTWSLDQAGLRRTLAETLSENFCDGFVAPFFFLCLGGPALLWLYKAVSTMDSMWGYKTPRFLDLGRAGALADDVLAYVPARLSAVFLLLAGFFLRLDIAGAARNTARHAARMASPNAGWSMAACAWLLGASMGGPAVYFGQNVEKPLLGPAGGVWTARTLGDLTLLLTVAGLLFGFVCLTVVFAL
ncbi:CobD/CbiB family cobalamin biosynthesis protein [Fundidesulfovibrio butyratiphilus]